MFFYLRILSTVHIAASTSMQKQMMLQPVLSAQRRYSAWNNITAVVR